jgi:hypothetical protein
MDGAGIPSEFLGIIAVFVVLGIVGFVIRLSLASNMARKSGLDPTDAALTTAFSDDGLAATYVAASMRNNSGQQATPPTRSVDERLRELAGLRDAALITPEEYDVRRTKILDEV